MKRAEIIKKLNLKIPVVASPMFLVSRPNLVVECCKNQILGTFPALNNRSTEGFENWLIEIKKEIKEAEEARGIKLPPYGVNLIVHGSNPRLQADVEVVVRQKVPIIISSLGAVKEVVDAVHSYGGLIFHDVISKRHAEKAIEAGVDGLILVCAGAGGHAGTLNPIAFVNEIRAIFDGVILLAGCLSTGQDVATALQMGADLAYMGTRFINTTEATAKPEYQEMIMESEAKDVVYTSIVSGVNANFLTKSLEKNNIDFNQKDHGKKIDFGEEMNQDEAKAWKDVWSAGQGVTSIHDVLPTADLVTKLETEFKEAIQRQADLLK